MERSRRPERGGGLLGGGLVAAAGILASLALVFSSATGVSAVAADARAQQRMEAVLGVTASARYALGQLLVLHEVEAADSAALELIRTDVDDTLEAAGSRVADALEVLEGDEAAAEISRAWEEAGALTEAFLELVDSGEIARAGEVAAGSLAPALDALTAAVAAERNTRAQAILAAEGEVGRVATAARFLVALGIPLVGIGAFILVLRRRQRRLALSLALDHERSLNRSKDQLIANLSHELRTPLTSIYGAALTLDEAGFDDPDLARELNGMVVEQSRDLTRMVDDLLVSAQAQADRLTFKIVPTEVAAEVDTVLGEFRRSGQPVVADLADAVAAVDPLRLRQILRNLVSNAARHGGGRIAVVGRPQRDGYRLSVVDDGPGVPADLEGDLFQPFVNAGQRALVTGSVGLGLSICRVLAEGMDASISYSRRGQTTWFTVVMPLAAGVEQSADVVENPVGVSSGAGSP